MPSNADPLRPAARVDIGHGDAEELIQGREHVRALLKGVTTDGVPVIHVRNVDDSGEGMEEAPMTLLEALKQCFSLDEPTVFRLHGETLEALAKHCPDQPRLSVTVWS